MEIKAAVFDLGGVVVEFHPVDFCNSFSDNEKEKAIFLSLMKSQLWLELDRGTKQKEDLIEHLVVQNKIKKEKAEAFFTALRANFKEIESTTLFIEKLISKNIEVYFLSNINLETFDYLSEKFNVFKYFKSGIKSEEVGFVKPEKEIFDRFLEETNLKTSEFVFFDDTLINVEKAKTLGWNVFEYNKYNSVEVQELFFNSLKKNKN